MGLETNFQSSVLAYLNSLPGCVAENVSGNSHQSGRPDVTGCFKGRMFKLELKTPDNSYQASKKQRLHLRRWLRAGCIVGVIYDMRSLKELFNLDWGYPAEMHYHISKDCESWYIVPSADGYTTVIKNRRYKNG